MEQDDDKISENYKQNVLLFEWFYVIPSSICNPDYKNRTCPGSNNAKNEDIVYLPRFSTYIFSEQELQDRTRLGDNYAMCDIYCSFDYNERENSGYIYDVTTDLNVNGSKILDGIKQPDLMYYFVNGQLSPKISMTTGEFRRLRMINSLSNWYLHFKFPKECQWYLSATDGVYIGGEYMNYNLSKPSHNYQYLMAPGGRADFFVKCMLKGTYLIKSTNDTSQDPKNLANLPERMYGGRTIFKLEVTDGTISPDAKDLPSEVPIKEKDTYIEDLTSLTHNSPLLETECDCNWNDPNNKECLYEFMFVKRDEVSLGAVNGKPFEVLSSEYPHLSDSLMLIKKNKAYEFIIDNNANRSRFNVGHVYHQHINPFQVQENIGNNGFIALYSTWWDTLGNVPQDPSDFIIMRFWSRNYDGLVILHCHLLQHEDSGMMGFYIIVDDDKIPDPQFCPNTGDTFMVNIGDITTNCLPGESCHICSNVETDETCFDIIVNGDTLQDMTIILDRSTGSIGSIGNAYTDDEEGESDNNDDDDDDDYHIIYITCICILLVILIVVSFIFILKIKKLQSKLTIQNNKELIEIGQIQAKDTPTGIA